MIITSTLYIHRYLRYLLHIHENNKNSQKTKFDHLMGEVLRERRLSRSESFELSVEGGQNISQKRRVSSAPADTTVNPSGLFKKINQTKPNFKVLVLRYGFPTQTKLIYLRKMENSG